MVLSTTTVRCDFCVPGGASATLGPNGKYKEQSCLLKHTKIYFA